MAEQDAQHQAEGGVVSFDEFETLLQKDFNPRSEAAKEEVSDAVRALAKAALGRHQADKLPTQSVNALRKMIAEIDGLLTDQINLILHHPEFQKLEGAWRGLRHLCQNTESGTDLKIRVMHATKKELAEEFAANPGDLWDQSALFKKLYTTGYGVLGGDPYGCIVGDYHFDHTAQDVGVLEGVSRIAAAAHAPFISGVSPNLFDLDDWTPLPDLRDLSEIVARPTHIAWNALRKKDDSRYIGLAGPRFLGRRAYGEENPVDAFDFVEDTTARNEQGDKVGDIDNSKFCWANSAYAMAANITRSFKLYGWCARIRGVESGGLVENLATHVVKTEKGSYDSQIPTEISIDDRREAEMAKLGLMPLVYSQNSNQAAFIGAQSLHEPPEFEDNPTGNYATSNAALGARLPYIFACSRFAHYLKHMVRNKIGGYMERDDMQRWLTNWINNYVEASDTASEVAKSKRPLKSAEVVVDEDPENPGYYDAKFFLRPHYQLEGANISLRLVSKLPSDMGG